MLRQELWYLTADKLIFFLQLLGMKKVVYQTTTLENTAEKKISGKCFF